MDPSSVEIDHPSGERQPSNGAAAPKTRPRPPETSLGGHRPASARTLAFASRPRPSRHTWQPTRSHEHELGLQDRGAGSRSSALSLILVTRGHISQNAQRIRGLDFNLAEVIPGQALGLLRGVIRKGHGDWNGQISNWFRPGRLTALRFCLSPDRRQSDQSERISTRHVRSSRWKQTQQTSRPANEARC